VARYHTFLHFVFSCFAWQLLGVTVESVSRDAWDLGHGYEQAWSRIAVNSIEYTDMTRNTFNFF
jgi:hypothetical protein